MANEGHEYGTIQKNILARCRGHPKRLHETHLAGVVSMALCIVTNANI